MDDKGISETVGWVIGFGVLLTAAVLIFLIVSPQVLSTSDRVIEEIGKVEMTMLDYTGSKVSLGDVPAQYVRFNLNGGSLKAETGGNRLIVNIVLQNNTKITVYNDSIGRVVFQKNDRKIGFEGGGVWLLDGDSSLMVSSPEFHYRIDTLTLPIVKIVNNFTVAGMGKVTIPIVKSGIVVYYPNTTLDPNFVNPVSCSYVEFKITSEFYKAWAKYAEERTSTNVTAIYDNNKTVVLVMTATYQGAKIPLSQLVEGFPLGKINSSDTTPINTFILSFEGLSQDLNLPLYTDTGSYELWIAFKKTGGGNTVDYLVVAYVDKINNKYESWVSTQPIPWDTSDSLEIDMLNNSILMEYTKQLHEVNIPSITGSSTFSDPTWTWNNDTYVQEELNNVSGEFNEGKILGLGDVIQHYFWVLAVQADQHVILKKPSGQQYKGYNETDSWILFDANLQSPYITYLHINEHRIRIGE